MDNREPPPIASLGIVADQRFGKAQGPDRNRGEAPSRVVHRLPELVDIWPRIITADEAKAETPSASRGVAPAGE